MGITKQELKVLSVNAHIGQYRPVLISTTEKIIHIHQDIGTNESLYNVNKSNENHSRRYIHIPGYMKQTDQCIM